MGKLDMPIALSAIPVGMAASILGYRASGGKDIKDAELAAQMGLAPGLLGSLGMMSPMGKRHSAKLDKEHTLKRMFTPAQFKMELAEVQDPKKNPALMGITDKKKLREAQAREAKNLFIYQRNKKLRARSLDKVVEHQTKRIPRRYLASLAAAGLTGAALQKGYIDGDKIRKHNNMQKRASTGTLLKALLPVAGASYGFSGYDLNRNYDRMRGISRKDEKKPDLETSRRSGLKGLAVGTGGLISYEALKASIPGYANKRSKKIRGILEQLQKNMDGINPRIKQTSYQFRSDELSDRVKTRPDGSKGVVQLNPDGTINFDKSKQPKRYPSKGPKPKIGPAVVVNPSGRSMEAFGSEYKNIKNAISKNQKLLKRVQRLPTEFNYAKPVIGMAIGASSLMLAQALGAREGRKQRK